MIEDEIIDRIERAASELETASLKAQRDMMRRVDALIRSMDFAADGTIKPSAENMKAVGRLYNDLKRVLARGDYAEAVQAYASSLGAIAEDWDGFFSDLLGSAFKPDRLLYERIWEMTASAVTQNLSGIGVQEVLGREAQSILRANILGKASAKEIEIALKEFIQGNPDKAGRLNRYVSQVARDGASQFSSSYTQAVSESLGLEWYYYSAGTVRDSRDFCRRKQGQYWHKSEIEAWALQKWAGKIPETNAATIFTYRGGYNCMHILRPVTERMVPESALARLR